jgi:GTP-binding protein HflX
VGFIQKLPTELIAAFRATLEEIADADILLHVVDITHPNANAQSISVKQTLVDIDAGEIPMITALNKTDLLANRDDALSKSNEISNIYPISAKTGNGLDDLLSAIEAELFDSFIEINAEIPYQQGQLISTLHELGQVNQIENGEIGTRVKATVPKRIFYLFEPYLTKKSEK